MGGIIGVLPITHSINMSETTKTSKAASTVKSDADRPEKSAVPRHPDSGAGAASKRKKSRVSKTVANPSLKLAVDLLRSTVKSVIIENGQVKYLNKEEADIEDLQDQIRRIAVTIIKQSAATNGSSRSRQSRPTKVETPLNFKNQITALSLVLSGKSDLSLCDTLTQFCGIDQQ